MNKPPPDFLSEQKPPTTILTTRSLMGLMNGLICSILVGVTATVNATVPGTIYPSMKTVFPDPVSGNEVWRMTTDGAQHGLVNAMGDQSSESSSWSPDSRRICYWKNENDYRPKGVYMMDIFTGIETYLAPANSNVHGGQVFSRDGTEVYYYHSIGSGRYDVRAVNVSTFAVRVIAGGLAMSAPQKITVNSDGTLIAIHQWSEPKQTAVLNPLTGEFLPGWEWGNGIAGEDGSQWHPTDPDIIFAVHGDKKVYNVHTLEALNPGDVGAIAHSSWHPDGSILVGRHTYNIATAGKWASGVYPGHPNINPKDVDSGWKARLVADGHGAEGPYLYVMPVSTFVFSQFPKAMQRVWAVHYSTEETNHAHPHPHFSPDGRYILWQSDVADVSAGAPPGGTGTGGIDLFIVPFNENTSDSGSNNPPIAVFGGPFNTVELFSGENEPIIANGTDFGAVAPGGAMQRGFRIVNLKNESLMLPEIGVDTVPFEVVAGSPVPGQPIIIPKGDDHLFTVQFSPEMESAFMDRITIHYTVEGEEDATFSFDVRGTGNDLIATENYILVKNVLLESDGLTIQFHANPHRSYQLFGSPNLVDWQNLSAQWESGDDNSEEMSVGIPISRALDGTLFFQIIETWQTP